MKNNIYQKKYDSFDPDTTYQIALDLASVIKAGTIICLEGDLGVGKTVFAKGLAKGLGILDPITSPTFTLVNVYEEGRLPLYHFDVYRIGDEEEMYEIGYEDYFYGQGVALVEWPSRISGLIPMEALKVTIEKDLSKGLDYRRIIMEGSESL